MSTTKTLKKGASYLIEEVSKDDVFIPEDFSSEQKQMGDTADQFVHNEVIPKIEEMDQQKFEIVVDLLKQSGELGLMTIDAPEEYGGLALDKATSMLVSEKMGAGGSFSVAFSAHSGIGTLPLVYYGTEEQKKKYLEKLVNGEFIGAYCLTEPESGSDALAANATATLSEDGKHYLLNGTKQFITNGGFADLFTVFAKIDKEHFTAFLVERDFEGVTIGAEEKKMGIKGSSTTQFIMENAKVPVENLLGAAGKGHKIAFNVLNVGRFKLGAAVTGAGKDAYLDAVRYAKTRKQFGTSISNFGAIQEKIADMTALLFASESLIYRLAGLLDQKLETIDTSLPNYYEEYLKGIEEYAIECAISKVFCSDILAEVVDEIVQTYGGYGFIAEYPAERYYRDERINRLFEGTNEINRLLIPGMMLKRAMKGELPLVQKAMKAMEDLMTPSFDEIDDSELFAKEKALLQNLKNLFLVVAGAAVQKFMNKIKDQQEILLALADVAIQVFAAESAILRAEKAYEKSGETKKEMFKSAVTIFTFYAVEKISTAAKKAAFYTEEGDNLRVILSGIRRYTKYDASDMLQAKKALAKNVIENERYPF